LKKEREYYGQKKKDNRRNNETKKIKNKKSLKIPKG
jgi:hypothetical protein